MSDANAIVDRLTLTPDEQRVLDHLRNAWNAFLDLPVEHADDTTEFRQQIHAAQDKVFSRPGRRQWGEGL